MAKIKNIFAHEIINSKGNPAIETTVLLNDGTSASASCPSGTSIGSYEAVELLDRDEKRYQGMGVLKAISNIQEQIAPHLVGLDVDKQQQIDKTMIDLDGTQNKSRLGANATLSISMAVAKAAAQSSVLPLFLYLRQFIRKENLTLKIPSPAFNVINGGLHANSVLDFQEFLLISASSKPFPEALQMASEIYRVLKNIIKTNNYSTLIGDEGGFSPSVTTNQEALNLLKQAVESSSYKLGLDAFIGLDAASSSFFSNGKYNIKDKQSPLSSSDLIQFYISLLKEYPLLYFEDPLAEDEWEGWANLSTQISNQVLVVGDDLTATNPYRLQMALDKKAMSGIVIKPNQIGTVIEALAVVEVAREAGVKIVVSHRSGETNDDFIADFSVAVSADYVKFGAPVRGERTAKYNRLLQIDRQIKTL